MAKKNKKNIKINQKIKTFFDGDPFDVGVERVKSETLSELFSALGIYEIDHSKDVLLKAVRMLWSEADSGFRAEILTFFENEGIVYPSDKTMQPVHTSLEKLDSVLGEFEMTPEEEAQIYAEFGDKRAKKITPQKIESKLRHIRLEAKRERIEKKLDGFFELDDSFEFNASIHYVIFSESFHKIEVLRTKTYTTQELDETSEEDIIASLAMEKDKAIQKRQDAVEDFIYNLPEEHKYLQRQEIVSSLRSSPPKITLYPRLKEDVLYRIISEVLELKDFELLKDEVVLSVKENIKLPFRESAFSYTLELHLELDSLLEDIWKQKGLDFSDVIHSIKSEHEKHFFDNLEDILDECRRYASTLNFTEEYLHQKIYNFLLDVLPASLEISPKIIRKTVRKFIYSVGEDIAKQQRQNLLAGTIRDFKNLFPMAREMRRKLTLHIGPTNSGKTYQAMQKLQDADTGYYLAPLRLLALEGYEGLKEKGIDSSLITGEEQIVSDEATHISSTIEMLNFEVDVDVCVIDEVQMIDDRDRGWAWANAIIGAPASEIIMTGSPNSKDAIVALSEYLGEELEIIEFERKNPLVLLDEPTDARDVKNSTAIIAFSRRDVLKLKQDFSKNFEVSVVYGNLSPEVRREEARRFREGETQILVATDAIAMGLNLPIQTLLFSKGKKFDGVKDRELTSSEIHQISGRAGRYGLSEEGFVGALDKDVLRIVKKNFHKPAKEIDIPFKVMANMGHIKLVANILEENSLNEIFKFFVDNMEFNGPFVASNLEDMLEASKIIDGYDLDIATKYHLSCAPLTLKSPYIISAFERYAHGLEQKLPIPYQSPVLHGVHAVTTEDLLRAEDMVKEISLYLWLSYRFKDYFIDDDKARANRGVINRYIELSLQQPRFVQTCRMCSAQLPTNSKHNICNRCFKKNYTGGRGSGNRGRSRS